MPLDLSPLWISLKVALLATIVTFFLGIAVAYWMLGYRGRGKSLIEGLLVSPLILPPTVVGFLLLLLLGKNGPIGQLLAPLNFSVVFTWLGAVTTATVVSFPLMYKTALGAFEQIDVNLLGVARTLGASEWSIFWRIVLPLALPGILAGTVLAFARALGEFGATLMLAGNIPGQTQTIPMAIYFAVEAGTLDEAWFWSIAILTISVSGIIAVNLWQATRSRDRIRQVNHQVSRQINRQIDQNSSRSLIQSSITQSSPVPQASLTVEIRKQLSGFQLDTAFQSETTPLGLLGGSGAGKSMILRCIAGVESPTSGRIVLNGRVLFDSTCGINRPSRDRRVGFLVQNYALFPHMSVAQNIAFGFSQPVSKAIARQRIEAYLQDMQLTGLADRYPHQLSGGQQQRVALARALASQPEVLLLDEPFSALDTHLRSQMEQALIAQLSQFQGVSLLVTHNLEEAYRVCQKLLVLEQGQIVAAGPKQAIFEHPGRYSVAQLTGCKNFSRAVSIAADQIEALDWGVRLMVVDPIPDRCTAVGIRAHQICFTTNSRAVNTFPCWLAATSETPHRMTVFLKLNAVATSSQDYHLQAEVLKEKWAALNEQPLPWFVQLVPLRLMLLE